MRTVSIETSKLSDFLGSQSVVGFQQSAKSFNTDDLSMVISIMHWFNNSAERLVNSLMVIIVAIIV